MTFRSAAGMSLIEVVVFIVVLAIGIAATLVVYNRVTSASVDPMVRKQALAIASSLLEEIELQPFTYCDPNDSNVYTADGTGPNLGCTSAAYVEQIGAETIPGSTVQTRYGTDPARFNNVNDYDTLNMSGANIKSADGTPISISGLTGYSVLVSVVNAGADFSLAAAEALRITVTVSGPTGVNVSLQGYRLRYAPNSP
jgi:MSHA pilin protein MshD